MSARQIAFRFGAIIFAIGVVLFALELLSIQAPDALLPLFIGSGLMLGSRLVRDQRVRGVDH